MRKIAFGAVLTVLILISSCKCTAERGAVTNVQKTHVMIAAKFLKYVDADVAAGKMTAADAADWRKLVESDVRNIEALKKSLGD